MTTIASPSPTLNIRTSRLDASKEVRRVAPGWADRASSSSARIHMLTDWAAVLDECEHGGVGLLEVVDDLARRGKPEVGMGALRVRGELLLEALVDEVVE